MTQLQPTHLAWHGAFEPETIAAVPTEAQRMKHRPFEEALSRFHDARKLKSTEYLKEL